MFRVFSFARSFPVSASLRIGFLVAFAAVGLWEYRDPEGYIAQRYKTPLGATETFLEMGLGPRGSGHELARILAEAPPGRTIAMFAPELDQGSSALAQNMSYLVWPRGLNFTVLTGTDRNERVARIVSTLHPAVVLFYRLSVPFEGATPLGPKLSYVRLP